MYPFTNREHGAECARLPLSNSPVTDVLSNDIRCNAGTSPASAKCTVPAGSTVTVEMHQVSVEMIFQRYLPTRRGGVVANY